MARKYPKKPKAPKRTASAQTWERHMQRLVEWKKACNKIDSERKRKADLIKRAASFTR